MSLKVLQKKIGAEEEKKKMFEEYCKRNETTLSMKFIEDVKNSGGVLSFVVMTFLSFRRVNGVI